MTAVLELENKESLTKLLKIAKLAGIYAKQRKQNPVSSVRQISDEEKRSVMGKRGIKIINDIRQRVIDAGETMTMDEINAEIAEARRERAMKEKCFA